MRRLSRNGGWLELVAEFFEERGFVERQRDGAEGTMEFYGYDGVVKVKLLTDEDRHAEILSAILDAGYEAASGESLYIAMPSNMAWKIDTAALRVRNIGLLLYDRMGVREELTPRRRNNGQNTAINQNSFSRLESMLNELDRRITRIETTQPASLDAQLLLRKLNTLEKRYEALLHELNILREKLEKLQAQERRPVQMEASRIAAPEMDGAPSFLRDNPWIEILMSKEV